MYQVQYQYPGPDGSAEQLVGWLAGWLARGLVVLREDEMMVLGDDDEPAAPVKHSNHISTHPVRTKPVSGLSSSISISCYVFII